MGESDDEALSPDAAGAWMVDSMLRAHEAFRHEPPVSRGRFKSLVCKHETSIVDPEARRVKCSKCGVRLDPIAVLAKLAREGGGDSFIHTREELAKLRKTVQRFEHREKLVKDRLRRLVAKAGISIALDDVEAALRKTAQAHKKLDEAPLEAAWIAGFTAAWHVLRDVRQEKL